MSEPLFWARSFEGKPRRSHGSALALAGLVIAAVSLTLAITFPPKASPLDLGAYWSAWAARTAWQGVLAVTGAWAALVLAPMRASSAKDRTLVWLGLALIWIVAALPPPMLARQPLHDAETGAKEIAGRYRGDAVRAKNDLVYQYNLIGLRYVFNGGALGGDPGLVQASAKLDRSRRLFADYRRSWMAAQDAERAELAKASPSSVPAVDAQIATERADARRFASLEDQYFDEAAAGLGALKSGKARWRGGAIEFTSPAVLEDLDRHFLRMRALQRSLSALEDSKIDDPFSTATAIWNESD